MCAIGFSLGFSKSQLADATGIAPPPATRGDKKKAEKAAKKTAPAAAGTGAGDLETQVAAQGEAVRKLKGDKADKAVIKEAVDKLLDLKKQVATSSGFVLGGLLWH